MQEIEATIRFARDRGDFMHPVVQKVRSHIPDWIIKLGTDAGIAAFNSYFQTELPEVLLWYFRNPDVAALIHAGCDLDAFLDDLSSCLDSTPPFVFYHSRHPHIVVGFHNHSGGVAAADLLTPESPIRFGDIDSVNFDFAPYDSTAIPFHAWVDLAIRNANYDLFDAKSRTLEVRY